MQAETDKVVIVITRGIESDLSSAAFAVANGGLTAGMKVSVFLTSTAIDLVRRGGHGVTQAAPFKPLRELIENFQKRGGTIWVCPPGAEARGYGKDDLIDGVVIAGSSAIFGEIKQGAATLSF
ncbi:MAG: peroxiredoxin [Reyranella sp.]|jgi:predicted peroxiredoxin|nr:MAG: peroxiredoxin [Reyranella sp.]